MLAQRLSAEQRLPAASAAGGGGGGGAHARHHHHHRRWSYGRGASAAGTLAPWALGCSRTYLALKGSQRQPGHAPDAPQQGTTSSRDGPSPAVSAAEQRGGIRSLGPACCRSRPYMFSTALAVAGTDVRCAPHPAAPPPCPTGCVDRGAAALTATHPGLAGLASRPPVAPSNRAAAAFAAGAGQRGCAPAIWGGCRPPRFAGLLHCCAQRRRHCGRCPEAAAPAPAATAASGSVAAHTWACGTSSA